MFYSSIKALLSDFKNGEISYIDAIEVLTDQFNYSSRDAEELVSSWEEVE